MWKKSDCYVTSFDEILNAITQSCEMDIIIRFFNNSTNRVDVRYWNSNFFGHGTSIDLHREFSNWIEQLDTSKMYQISMDGPSVNWTFYRTVSKEREENELHELINVGSCGLHVLHGAFKSGAEATDWNIKKTLRGSFQILHDSPARREDYESVTGCNQYPLFYCATRYVLNVFVIIVLSTPSLVCICPVLTEFLLQIFMSIGSGKVLFGAFCSKWQTFFGHYL